MRRLAALLLVLWAAPVAAQDSPCVVSKPSKGDIRVKCGDVEIGDRENADGTHDELKRERDWKLLGVKRWKSKRIKTQDFPPEADPVAPDVLPDVSLDVPPVAADTQVVHDVGIVYTPRAETAQGGAAAVQALCTLSVAVANETYANSNVNLRLDLKFCRLVNYVEQPANWSSDLSRLQSTTDGILNEAHTLRDQYGADLVTLMGDGYAAQGNCGVAYGFNGFNGYGFSVVDRTCMVGRPSYGHELGHNAGLQHNPENAACGGVNCPSYNYGHQFGDLGTMLSYRGNRVRYLSSPLVIGPNGLPTGTDTRDNARMLRLNMASIANFRPTVTPPDIPAPPGKPAPLED